MPSPVQRNFSAGELSPAMYANADMVRYQQGLKKLRNAIVLRTGGVQNRPGTEYCGTTKSNGAVRLVPAVFDTDASYVLEFGNQYVRVWKEGALVDVGTPAAWQTATAYIAGVTRSEGGTNYVCIEAHTSGTFATDLAMGKWYALTGSIYEWPTPYTAAELFGMQFAYQYNVVTIVHPNHRPADLTRASDAVWTLADIDFVNEAPTNLTASVGGTGGMTYVVTAVFADGSESGPSTPDETANSVLSFSNCTLTWTAVTGAVSYNVYRAATALYTPFLFIGTSTSTTLLDISPFTASSVMPPSPTDLFETAGNYPSVVGAYQQRLILAGTENKPDFVYASKVALPYDFTTSNPMQDDDSMEWRQVGRRLNRIQHFAEVARALIQFSDVGESVVQGDTDGILRPGEVNPRQFSENGSGELPPLVINDSALYVQARGGIVRDIAPIEAQGFGGSDLTLQAAHLVDGFQLVDWCYQQTPNSVVWAIRDDGTLLSLTYVRELGILGWATHDTGGEFESIACVPEGSRDVVYLAVSRTVDGNTVRYVERFADRQADEPVLTDSSTSSGGGNGVFVVPAGLSAWTERTVVAGYDFVAAGGGVAIALDGNAALPAGTIAYRYTTDGSTWTLGSATIPACPTPGEDWDGFNVASFQWWEAQSKFLGIITAEDTAGNVFWYYATTTNGIAFTFGDTSVVTGGDAPYLMVLTPTTALVYSDPSNTPNAKSTNGTVWTTFTGSGVDTLYEFANRTRPPIAANASGSLIAGLADVSAAPRIVTSANGEAWSGVTMPSFTGTLTLYDLVRTSTRWAVLYGDDDGYGLVTSELGVTWVKEPFPASMSAVVPEFLMYESSSDVVLVCDPTSQEMWLTDLGGTYSLLGEMENTEVTTFLEYWADRFTILADTGGSTLWSATYTPEAVVGGLDYLEGELVAATSGGVVLTSPYNSAYTPVTVTGGTITLGDADVSNGVTVGLPMVTDIQTLDIDTAGGTMKPQKFLITNVGAYLEDSMAFFAGPEEPTTSTGLTLPSGGAMQQLQVVDRDENAATTPQSGFRSLNFEGRWSESGSVFIRNVDPTPLTVLALVPYGTYPPR